MAQAGRAQLHCAGFSRQPRCPLLTRADLSLQITASGSRPEDDEQWILGSGSQPADLDQEVMTSGSRPADLCQQSTTRAGQGSLGLLWCPQAAMFWEKEGIQ